MKTSSPEGKAALILPCKGESKTDRLRVSGTIPDLIRDHGGASDGTPLMHTFNAYILLP